MSNKTIYQMSLRELREECECRDISSVGSKDDLLVILEQRLTDDGLNPRTALFPVNTSRVNIPPTTETDGSVTGLNDGYIDEELANLRLSYGRGNSPISSGRSSRSERRSRVNSRNSTNSVRPTNFANLGVEQQMDIIGAEIADAEGIHQEVERYRIENRLESIETALVDIRNSLRIIDNRQSAIENRLDSLTCSFCGRKDSGRTRNVVPPHNTPVSHLDDLCSRLADVERSVRRSIGLPTTTNVNTRPSVTFTDTRTNASPSNSSASSGRNSHRPVSTNNTRMTSVPYDGNDTTVFARVACDNVQLPSVNSTRVGVEPCANNASEFPSNELFNSRLHTVGTETLVDQTVGSAGHSGSRIQSNNPGNNLFNFKLTPPQFSGKKYEDPNKFIKNFEVVLHSSGIPESAWVQVIGDQLSESAASWYNLVKSMGLSWSEFVLEFADRWDSPAIRSQLTTEVMSVRQRPQQALTDFCIYKYNLSKRLGLRLPEKDVVDIVVGLVRDEFMSVIRLSNPGNFRELRQVAKHLDGSRHCDSAGPDNKPPTGNSQAVNIGKGGPRDFKPAKNIHIVCKICGGAHYPNKCPSRTGTIKPDDKRSINYKNSGNDNRVNNKTDKSPRK